MYLLECPSTKTKKWSKIMSKLSKTSKIYSFAALISYAKEHDGDPQAITLAEIAINSSGNLAAYLNENYSSASTVEIFRAVAGDGAKTSDPQYKPLYNVLNYARGILVDSGAWKNNSRKKSRSPRAAKVSSAVAQLAAREDINPATALVIDISAAAEEIAAKLNDGMLASQARAILAAWSALLDGKGKMAKKAA